MFCCGRQRPSLQEACRQAGRWNAGTVHGMKRPVNRTLCALLWLALTAGGCGHDIGDSCKTSVDCDPNGTRSCDLSQPGGYCTLAGCDETSCPSGATCIRLFPEKFLSASATTTSTAFGMPCGPSHADAACDPLTICATSGTSSGLCTECDPAHEDVPSDAGVTQNRCLSDEICLDSGLCAKQSSEQRECAKACSSNNDCRSGYDCRKAGEMGSMVLATNPLATTSFCAPHVAVDAGTP